MTGVAFFDIDSFQLEEGVVATEYERPAPAPDYPIEIHSLNDFDIVSSVGKENLLKGMSAPETLSAGANNAYGYQTTTYDWEAGETYTFSADIDIVENASGFSGVSLYPYNGGSGGSTGYGTTMTPIVDGRVSMTFKANENLRQFLIYAGQAGYTNNNTIVISNRKLEKTSTLTPYNPASEDITEDDSHPLIDKINILLDEPLRSVGDVKDRLFRDSDGLWKVERNVGELTINNSSGWAFHIANSNTEKDNYESQPVSTNIGRARSIISDRFIGTLNQNAPINHIRMSASGYLNFGVKKGTITNLSQWFKDNPFTIVYEEERTVEVLPMSTQDKLNNLSSFSNSNYVYTVDNNNLKPNLNVVFKSKGWKHKQATDNLETDVSNKADKSDVESGFSDVNESIDEFKNNYESYQDSVAKSMEDASTELQKALERTSIIEANLGEGAADWIFTHTQIRMSDEGVMIGQKEAGSYLQISDNQISFFNGSEDPVAFINGGMLHINHAIFVESIQISGFMISSEIKDHITFRYVGN